MPSRWCPSLLLSIAAPTPAFAIVDPGSEAQVLLQDGQDLSSLSIEELAQIPVRSASKHEEPLSAAPTALYVITNEAILRSAATSLPEVLRLAPNLQVQRVNAREYAISARGFNGIETSNKLLLLVDGRSGYSTLHSGIFWELRSPLLEDIEQIEVISGPGGTLYGPNAVNGVINLVAKDARDTQGLLARGTAGAQERTAAARYGFALGDAGAMRVFANYFDREDQPAGAGPDMPDGIRGWQAGFRGDIGSGDSRLTLSGDIFDNETFLLPDDFNRGHNLLARWNQSLGAGSSLQVQGYYDYFVRRQLMAHDSLQTFDVEAQVNARSGAHDLVAGFGIRTTRDEFVNDLNIFRLSPNSERLWVFNGFIQDRFALTDQLSLTAGVKVERSSFSGFEVLPNVRLSWQPSSTAMLWAAVSRAVRTPSRIDRQLNAPGFLATAPAFRSEKLIAFEAGYRGQPSSSTTLSVSLFFNHYDDLRTLTWTNGGTPYRLANDLRGNSYGAEAWGSQQVFDWWRLSAGAALLGKDFEVKPGAIDLGAMSTLGNDPEYQFKVRSEMNLSSNLTFDLGFRAIGGLDYTGTPAYAEAEARISWLAGDHVELFAAGTDLLHASHLESGDTQRGQRVERAVHIGSRLRF